VRKLEHKSRADEVAEHRLRQIKANPVVEKMRSHWSKGRTDGYKNGPFASEIKTGSEATMTASQHTESGIEDDGVIAVLRSVELADAEKRWKGNVLIFEGCDANLAISVVFGLTVVHKRFSPHKRYLKPFLNSGSSQK
jgi:hypothetical protein